MISTESLDRGMVLTYFREKIRMKEKKA